MVFWWLLAATAISSALGYGLWRLLRRLRRRWLRILISSTFGLTILVAAGGAFVYLGFAPAADELTSENRVFAIYTTTAGVADLVTGSRQSRDVDFERASGIAITDLGPIPTQRFFDQLPKNQTAAQHITKALAAPEPSLLQRIRITVPDSVTPRQDFSISLSIDGYGRICGNSEEQTVLLSASSSANARTSDRCQTAKVPEGFSGACATPTGCSSHFTWDLTPTESGELSFTLTLPPSTPIVPSETKVLWEGYILDSKAPLWQSVTPFNSGNQVVPLRNGQASLDISRQQIRVPVDVISTLGVNRSTYNWLALFGTVFSAFLGTGWLWQLIAAVRSRHEKKPLII